MGTKRKYFIRTSKKSKTYHIVPVANQDVPRHDICATQDSTACGLAVDNRDVRTVHPPKGAALCGNCSRTKHA